MNFSKTMARKIRSIEIEAFRGYDSKQLFNLTTANGKLANLNVLYAPNGFGKTSFIDAVEWALTGQITRFQNSIIFNTADRHAGSILHNYDSKLAVGKVDIAFEDGLSITRITRNNRRNRQWDFNEGKLSDEAGLLNAGLKGGHRIVDTLTQESTDQSVCFTTPEQRFDALRPLWDSNNDTYIYKSLLGMAKIARDQKKELESDIAGLNKDIETSFKNQGVSVLLNKQLGMLNEISQTKIEPFPDEISPVLLTKRLELLIKSSNTTTLEISAIKESLEIIASLQSRFDSYSNNIAALNNISAEIASLHSAILDANKLNSALETLQELREKRSNEVIKINQANNLANIVEDFLHAINAIESNTNSINVINEKINEISAKELEYKSISVDKRRDLTEAQARIDNIVNDIFSLNTNRNKLISLNEEKEHVSAEIIKTQLKLSENRSNSEKLSTSINKLRSYLSASRTFFLNEGNIEESELNSQFIKTKQDLLVLEQKEVALKSAEDSFRRLKTLNDTLLDIINLGKHLISETNADACPLCATEFSSHNELIRAINERNIGSDDKIDLNYYKEDLNTANNNYNASASLFIEQVNKVIRKQEITLLSSRNLLSTTEDTLYSISNSLKNINSEIDRINSFIVDQLAHIKSGDATSAINILENNLAEARKSVSNLLVEVSQREDLLKSIRQEIELLTSSKGKYEIDTASKNSLPVYSYGFVLLKELGISLEDISALNVLLERSRKSIDDLTNTIDAEELSIKHYFESTQGKGLEEINSEVLILRANATYIEQETSMYTSDWSKILKNKKEFHLADLSRMSNEFNQKLSTLNLLNSRFTELIAFVQSLKQGIELNYKILNKQEQLAKVTGALNELENAKDKSISYIENKIHQEFNEKLINDIYQKVEPHPTLKEIKFVPELDGDKAKLDILVNSNSKTGSSKAPVVYFSAAQINILSLSIFLAKSLQNDNKAVNTIFMDDPIQFLDSINTLSFIDLIRVITSEKGLNQQVFISTHDESFFKLLKRKIDPSYYASNFMELETFGIIKKT
jgi:exonuclease SbcC